MRCFLFASRFMAEMTEEFWEGQDFRWKLLRNPFNPMRYKAHIAPGNYALYFGRIIGEKGVNVLVDAAAMSPDVPVVIVGDGPDYESLKRNVAERKLVNVSFTGAKWGDELEHLIRESGFVVVPSLWHENFPYVILEAFAHGKAVVGAHRGGIPELVLDGERGFTYEATDARALSEKLDQMHSSPALQQKLGLAARAFVEEEFGDAQFYRSLNEIYRSLE